MARRSVGRSLPWTRLRAASLQQWLPAVLTAASWVALWLLWPKPAVEGPRRTAAAAPVAYSHSPQSPSPFGWGSPFAGPWKEPGRHDQKAFLELAAFFPAADAPSFLESGSGRSLARERMLLAAVDPAGPRSMRAGRRMPLPDHDQPAVEPDAPGMRLSPALRAAEFSVADEDLEQLKLPEESSGIRLQVLYGSRGRVKHVFVEQGSGDRDLDNKAVRAVQKARLATGIEPGRGWVAIYGETR